MTVPLYSLVDTWTGAGQDAIKMSVTTGGNSGNLLHLAADGSDYCIITNDGQLALGALPKQAFGIGGANAAIQTQTLDSRWGLATISYSTTAISGARFGLARSRATTPGSFAAVQSGDVIGQWESYGDIGTSFVNSGSIRVICDGTPGTVAPGRIGFFTSTSSAILQKCCRYDSAQQVFFPGVTTTASGANVFMDNTTTPVNQILRSTSSLRYKADVASVPSDRVAAVAAIQPIEFRSLGARDDQTVRHVGYAAERVAEIDPALVTRDASGRPDGVAYERILLLKVAALEHRVRELEDRAGKENSCQAGT